MDELACLLFAGERACACVSVFVLAGSGPLSSHACVCLEGREIKVSALL